MLSLSLSRTNAFKTPSNIFHPLTRAVTQKVPSENPPNISYSCVSDPYIRTKQLSNIISTTSNNPCDNLSGKKMEIQNSTSGNYRTLLTELRNGTFIITINRPDKRNALNQEVINELSLAIHEIYINPDIKTAIITGAGDKAFVAGADISELAGLDQESAVELARKVQSLFNKIMNCLKVIIAAVNGVALGGGCELALACHIIMASDIAQFGLPESGLGVIPAYGGTQRLTQEIGRKKALEMMATGDRIGSREAYNRGFVNHVEPSEKLLEKAYEIAQKIQKMAPLAVTKIIACVNDAASGNSSGFDNEIQRFGECFTTQDMQEGIKAFLAKRPTVFTGK